MQTAAMIDPSLSRLAVAAVVILIATLAYSSQYFLLHNILSSEQTIFFNIIIAFVWITYYRCIFTPPGSPPPSWEPPALSGAGDAEEGSGRPEDRKMVASTARWCKKCERPKPPRAHHCRTCNKYPYPVLTFGRIGLIICEDAY